MPPINISPSILSADQDNLTSEIIEVAAYSDLIHVDIMDNVFVPVLTKGPEYLKTFQTTIPLDIHLMVDKPSNEYVKSFLEQNEKLTIENITVHQEACPDLSATLSFIRSLGVKAGVVINPPTSLDAIKPVLDTVDKVMFMTVNPGWSGQKFIPEVLDKVRELRALKPGLDLEIDGGINLETAPLAKEAGINVFAVSSYIFKAPDKEKAIKDLRAILG